MASRHFTYMGSLLALIPLVLSLSGAKVGAAETKAPETMQAVLDAQVVAWNGGDIAGFMAGYQRSPDLIYIGNKTVVRGWQELFDSYRSRFNKPGGVEMGVLRLSEEHVIMMKNDAAVVWGKFDVSTSDGKRRGGLYTLVMRKLAEGWRTVYDRTSTEDL
jgi:hypothetical protein